MAFLDRRVHKCVGDFLGYLSQTMPVVGTSVLVRTTEPNVELTQLDGVCEGEILVLKLRNEEWRPPASMLMTPKQEPVKPKIEPRILKPEMEINPKFRALSNQIQKLVC